MFRNGQRNNHVACLGPFVCRIVTCTPPWLFDGSCWTRSATDNRTADHYAPCLQQPFGSFGTLSDAGAAIRFVGWAIDENLRDGIEVRIFIDQSPFVSTMANLPRHDVASAYPYYGPDHGFDITIDATPGRHVVCVVAIDQGSGEGRLLKFDSVEIAAPVSPIEAWRGPANLDDDHEHEFRPRNTSGVSLDFDGRAVRIVAVTKSPDTKAQVR